MKKVLLLLFIYSGMIFGMQVPRCPAAFSSESSDLSFDKRLLLQLQLLPNIWSKNLPELTVENHQYFSKYCIFILLGKRVLPFVAMPGLAMGAYDLYHYFFKAG